MYRFIISTDGLFFFTKCCILRIDEPHFKNFSCLIFSSSIYWVYYMRILEYLKIIAGFSNSFAHLNCVHPGHGSPFGDRLAVDIVCLTWLNTPSASLFA